MNNGIKINMEPVIIDVDCYEDDRGKFYESYRKTKYSSILDVNFVQDSQSISKKNVIRGLHYQYNPSIVKLVRVSQGSILDVVVDLNVNSKFYKKIYYFELNDRNLKQLLVPYGFAHGFLSLEDNTHVHYKFDNYYNKDGEGGIYPFDTDLYIEWGISKEQAIVSEKDKSLQSFKKYLSNPKF